MADLKQILIDILKNRQFQSLAAGFVIGAAIVFIITRYRIAEVNFLGISFVDPIRVVELRDIKLEDLEREVDDLRVKIQTLENKVESREREIFTLKQGITSSEYMLRTIRAELEITKKIAKVAAIENK